MPIIQNVDLIVPQHYSALNAKLGFGISSYKKQHKTRHDVARKPQYIVFGRPLESGVTFDIALATIAP